MLHTRVFRALQLILGFWGMQYDPLTGKVGRSTNWESRFRNLNRRSHNYLRVTRVLKCMGELGFEHVKLPLCKRLIDECFVHGTLPAARDSCEHYWLPTLRLDAERGAAQAYLQRRLRGGGGDDAPDALEVAASLVRQLERALDDAVSDLADFAKLKPLVNDIQVHACR